MRHVLISLGLLLATGMILPARAAAVEPSLSLRVDIGLFYDDLAPYGDWIDYGEDGYAWVPRHEAGWRPYSLGHWVWTDEYGWLWVSDEDFGWATYHYGRWVDDDEYGWVWVPGYEWGPAWVSWRLGDGYIGWAPLPPDISWDDDGGFRTDDIDTYVPASRYCFVPERHFVDHAVYRHFVPRSEARGYFRTTRNVTDYRPHGDRVVNRGVNVEQVQEAIGRAVPRLRAVDVGSVRAVLRADVRGGQVPVFRPRLQPHAVVRPPAGSEDQRAYVRPPLDPDRGRSQETQRLERQRQIEPSEARDASAAAWRDQQELRRVERTRAEDLTRRQEREAVALRQAQERQRLETERSRAQHDAVIQARPRVDQDAFRRAEELGRRPQGEYRATADRRPPMEAQRELVRREQEQLREAQGRAHTEHAQPSPPARSQGSDKNEARRDRARSR